jgi:hypothetical protein
MRKIRAVHSVTLYEFDAVYPQSYRTVSMLRLMLFRFLIGGVVVSAFSALGDILKPKSLAGLFGAAPSVALATLALTIATDGHHIQPRKHSR